MKREQNAAHLWPLIGPSPVPGCGFRARKIEGALAMNTYIDYNDLDDDVDEAVFDEQV